MVQCVGLWRVWFTVGSTPARAFRRLSCPHCFVRLCGKEKACIPNVNVYIEGVGQDRAS